MRHTLSRSLMVLVATSMLSAMASHASATPTPPGVPVAVAVASSVTYPALAFDAAALRLQPLFFEVLSGGTLVVAPTVAEASCLPAAHVADALSPADVPGTLLSSREQGTVTLSRRAKRACLSAAVNRFVVLSTFEGPLEPSRMLPRS